MNHKKIVPLIIMFVVFGGVAGTCWALANVQQPTQTTETTDEQPPPNNVPKLMIHEQMRDATMAFIVANHPEAAQFAANLAWTGGRRETGLLGAETYIYQSQGWALTIKYPVVADPVYNITVEYSTVSDGPSVPYHLDWQGTWHAGFVTEERFVFAQ
jgi:hypothetical protein